MIQAIETEYRGYRFRSRLEARWAVFFDAMGYTWRYEHQGFECGKERYLPDFEIDWKNGETLFVEVKGDSKALANDFKRYVTLLDFGGCLPGFDDCRDTGKSGLLLLGDIPEAHGSTWYHPIIQHHEGLHRSWACFAPEPIWLSVVGESDLAILMDLFPDHCIEGAPDHWEVEARSRNTLKAFNGVNTAYKAARGARFEHGEKGARK